VYLPGIYTVTVKRPDGAGVGGIITTFSFWLLASMTAPEFELQSVLVVFFLFLSLWSVYEIGYMDNDICARKFETDPVFTNETIGYPYKRVQRSAWIFAIIAGGVGCVLARDQSWMIMFGEWLLILVLTRGLYFYYNRIDKNTRVWLYLILQLARDASFILVVPVGTVGVMACMAQIIAKWQQYFIYRYIRVFDLTKWPELQVHTIRLILFIALVGTLSMAEQSVNPWRWPTAAIIVWCVLLAHKEIPSIIKATHRIDGKARDIPLFGGAPGECARNQKAFRASSKEC
jgi:hypothetical protein